LRQIQQLVLLYPPQGEKGPNRVATVAVQTAPHAASLGKNSGPRSAADYPTWVILAAPRKLLTIQILTALCSSFPVNFR
jgi:hypothetical protein